MTMGAKQDPDITWKKFSHMAPSSVDAQEEAIAKPELSTQMMSDTVGYEALKTKSPAEAAKPPDDREPPGRRWFRRYKSRKLANPNPIAARLSRPKSHTSGIWAAADSRLRRPARIRNSGKPEPNSLSTSSKSPTPMPGSQPRPDQQFGNSFKAETVECDRSVARRRIDIHHAVRRSERSDEAG